MRPSKQRFPVALRSFRMPRARQREVEYTVYKNVNSDVILRSAHRVHRTAQVLQLGE